ncbi:tRNA (adenosine(37)-N6)-dimethylallyltransferase MiaA [Candidatus Nomurabacteria bacterium]|nr:tRNA (adenosine(37)-N6)-dimethylallyltransferase MiaA [Candidatus Nomurabacteria bacterium]
MEPKPKILVIVGPTASGKSDLAVKLAKKLNGEVISADSRQVYKGLNIGTGKITKKEMWGVKHHLLDVASPKKRFTVADYKKLADKVIKNVLSRGKLPIICGGTGFYIQAVVDDLILPEVEPNLTLRKQLEKKTANELHKILLKLDKNRANNIDKNNSRRLIRAIEIAKALGKVPKITKNSKYSPIIIGIKTNPEELKKKIYKRLLARIKTGMIYEAKRLHKNGLSWKRMEELGLEYRYMARFLQKKITKQELIDQLFSEIWKYSKRQMTWFKRDRRVEWKKY